MIVAKEISNLKIISKFNNETVKVTISIGVGNYPKHTNNLEKLKEITDKALYKAKEKRNNVVKIS